MTQYAILFYTRDEDVDLLVKVNAYLRVFKRYGVKPKQCRETSLPRGIDRRGAYAFDIAYWGLSWEAK